MVSRGKNSAKKMELFTLKISYIFLFFTQSDVKSKMENEKNNLGLIKQKNA